MTPRPTASEAPDGAPDGPQDRTRSEPRGEVPAGAPEALPDPAPAPGGPVGDAWPELRERPVLRRSVGVFLALCGVFTVLVAGWGVVALTRDHTRPETDLSRAERLAGLHSSQHPGQGRYYIPDEVVLTRTADGSEAGYLHYRLDGGQDVNVDDFLRTYNLPEPGTPAQLPGDLVQALPGEEPAVAPSLPGSSGSDGHRQIFVAPAENGPAGAGDVYVRATG
ncbi:hypothetical protein [Streptomyces sp. CB03911]|uniref:hypothetical protein n=1 Tax=Streptomyces sp. CB03911 TaxID=1804758 RepID=UPI00093F7B47|nr:hypothetical protein [Streptomyces sp. CB03911]OKI30146.1 hypothetical protein A6A07_22870 [Streptomyces sp. CB03911]